MRTFKTLVFSVSVARQSVLAAGLLLAGASALAQNDGCWNNPQLTQLATRLAQQHFPAVAQNMPTVVECPNEVFPDKVAGDYTMQVHRIRMPISSRQNSMTRDFLAHELAHAAVALRGLTGGSQHQGHDSNFYQELMTARFAHEARRTVEYLKNFDDWAVASSATSSFPQAPRPYGGGGSVILTSLPPAPPAPPVRIVQQCQERPVWQHVWNGRFMQPVMVAIQRQCWAVAVQSSHQ